LAFGQSDLTSAGCWLGWKRAASSQLGEDNPLAASLRDCTLAIWGLTSKSGGFL